MRKPSTCSVRETHANVWSSGVELPRVKIHADWASLRVSLRNRALDDPDGEHPQIPAPRKGTVPTQHAAGRNRKLPERFSAMYTNPVRFTGRIGYPAVVPVHWQDARIERDPCPDEDIENPLRVRAKRKRRCAVPPDRLPGRRRHRSHGLHQIRLELGARHRVYETMPMGVRGHFVTSRGDLAYHSRITLRDPPKDEKRRLDAGAIEEGQRSLCRRLDPARVLGPAISRHLRCVVEHVKPFLEIHRDRVRQLHSTPHISLPADPIVDGHGQRDR